MSAAILADLLSLYEEIEDPRQRVKDLKLSVRNLTLQIKGMKPRGKTRRELEARRARQIKRLEAAKAALAALGDQPAQPAKVDPDKPEGAKVKRAPAGSQLPPETRKRLVSLGVKTLPPAHVNPSDITLIDLHGDDIHTKAVAKWVDPEKPPNPRTGKIAPTYAYTAKHGLIQAKKKFKTATRLLPEIDKHRVRFVNEMKKSPHGSEEESAHAINAIITRTGLRVGGLDQLYRDPPTFGVTTLRKEHVNIDGDTIKFDFLGKDSKRNVATIKNKDIADVLSRLVSNKEPSDEIFPDVNDSKLSTYQPRGVKNKDWRTVVASEATNDAIASFPPPPPPLSDNPAKAKRQMRNAVVAVSRVVAEVLNNTPAVARSSYINPLIFEKWKKEMGYKGED